MTYKVLALDGGGLKGLFTASFLAAVEEDIKEPVVDYFDLVVGTSTGGIIALGLGAGLSASKIAEFYEKKGPPIFPKWRGRIPFLNLFVSKYEARGLKKALTDIIGDKRLGDSATRLVIPSAHLDTGEVFLNKTSHNPRFMRDYRQPMVDVAMATASAPGYFPPFKGSDVGQLVDGGIWANNPLGLAAVEAVGVLEWPRNQIKILSIGTTSEPLDAGARHGLGGLISWRKVVDVILAVQSSGSVGTAQHLVGHENVVRIDPKVPPRRYAMDKTDEFKSLKDLGYSEARKAISGLKPMFFEEKAAPFEPYHKL